MTRPIAAVLTILIMGMVLAFGLQGSNRSGTPTQAAESTPESAIRDLFAATASGQVDRYLDAFAGPLRERREAEIRSQGANEFASRLRSAAASRKSYAVFLNSTADEDATTTTADVESVYADRNESQVYRLERIADRWHIVELGPVRTRQPAVAFGSSAEFRAPEGIPVPVAPADESGPEPDSPTPDPEEPTP